MTGPAPDTDNAEKGPLAGSGLEHLASVYEALANLRGMSPREADDLYLWEIAVVLGVKAGGTEQAEADPYAHLRARAAGQDFEWPAPTPDELAGLMDLMGELS